MELILGSKSKSRQKILSFFTLPYTQIGSDFQEDLVPFSGNPQEYVQILSQRKAEVLAKKFPSQPILTADTVVFFNYRLYHKPKDKVEAYRFFSEFSGNWHQVFTGVTVRQENNVYSGFEETKVLFQKLLPDQIQKYQNIYNPLDKSGGYSIDEAANLIISRIEGCHYNVLGLPLNLTCHLLKSVGIDLWDFLKPVDKQSY